MNPADPTESVLYRDLRWQMQAFLAIFALEIIGDDVLPNAGLGEGPAATNEFIAWFARLLNQTLR